MQRLLIAFALCTSPAFAQTNIAPAGTASQSSDHLGAIAGRANDGNLSPLWTGGSIQHTDNFLNSWWQVDFSGNEFEMSEIRIYPRTDCCTDRNNNLHVAVFMGSTEVWSVDLYTVSGTLNGSGEILPLPPGTTGDRVRVQFNGFNLSGNGYMHLAEVEIDGQAAASSNFCGPAVLNSSGASAEMNVVGINQPGRPLGLIANNLPSSEFGYFLIGSGTSSISPPGSIGNLCILGGVVGRFNRVGEIKTSQFNGDTFGLSLNTLNLPSTPAVPQWLAKPGTSKHGSATVRPRTSATPLRLPSNRPNYSCCLAGSTLLGDGEGCQRDVGLFSTGFGSPLSSDPIDDELAELA